MSAESIRRILVMGRVQGVGYRAFVLRESRRRGIEGWVRNLPDGSVEAVLACQVAAVKAVIAVCYSGPPGSRVTDLTETSGSTGDLDLRPEGVAFAIL
ncbi:MAG: acylphosphatase [Xanthobacteraceae bacterium]